MHRVEQEAGSLRTASCGPTYALHALSYVANAQVRTVFAQYKTLIHCLRFRSKVIQGSARQC